MLKGGARFLAYGCKENGSAKSLRRRVNMAFGLLMVRE